MGAVGVPPGMDTTLPLAERHYVACPSDEGWFRCEFCGEKVFAGENRFDLKRHEERCEWR